MGSPDTADDGGVSLRIEDHIRDPRYTILTSRLLFVSLVLVLVAAAASLGYYAGLKNAKTITIIKTPQGNVRVE